MKSNLNSPHSGKYKKATDGSIVMTERVRLEQVALDVLASDNL